MSVSPKEFARSRFSLTVQSVDLELAAIHRGGELAPILFLHGFGSTKEDYADIVRHAAFAGHPFVAHDAPRGGSGRTSHVRLLPQPSPDRHPAESSASSTSKGTSRQCATRFGPAYGEQNTSLSYLSHLRARGVRLAEIPDCGHFPMYSNPPLMWKAIADFQATSNAAQVGIPAESA
jgi:pimeloyl-ACP methyl ester carboxylesterase